MSIVTLQDQTDKTGGAFVDDAVQRAPEFSPNILRHTDHLGGQTLLKQIVHGFAENITLPQLIRIFAG